ncbi:MAG TPA: ribonuclease III [Bryobacteraceae bacterium]|nr:ribonuclease III [Bryobacteraceae bacterium]
MAADLTILESALGHTFKDRELLERALTHKSRVYEKASESGIAADNEQLEFLGDSILGFVVSECLVRRFPSFPEGRLSKLKAHLVSAARLHEVAQELGLGEYLILGRGEEMSGGREKKALLSDAVEALIAALYLDAGLEVARRFIETRVIGALHSGENAAESAVTDYKSALQEMAQTLKLPPPRYVIVAENGPEHSKTFTVEVRLGKEWVSQAQGLSKKSAGQRAAQQILQQLTEWGR